MFWIVWRNWPAKDFSFHSPWPVQPIWPAMNTSLPLRGDAVGEALGARPAGRLQDLHHAFFLSLKRCSFPVSVRGSVSTNSTARGYL